MAKKIDFREMNVVWKFDDGTTMSKPVIEVEAELNLQIAKMALSDDPILREKGAQFLRDSAESNLSSRNSTKFALIEKNCLLEQKKFELIKEWLSCDRKHGDRKKFSAEKELTVGVSANTIRKKWLSKTSISKFIEGSTEK